MGLSGVTFVELKVVISATNRLTLVELKRVTVEELSKLDFVEPKNVTLMELCKLPFADECFHLCEPEYSILSDKSK